MLPNIKSLLLRDVLIARNGKVLTSSLPEESSLLADESRRPDWIGQVSTIKSMKDVEGLPQIERDWDTNTEDSTKALVATVRTEPTEHESLQASVLIPEKAVFGFYHDFQRVLLVLGAITIGLSVLVTFKIGAIISEQVQKTLATLEKVASGDLASRLDIDTKDEFGRISTALNTAIAASANTLDSLAIRNRDTKMLLDAVEQGFFTVDADGVMSEERSGAVDRLFGPPQPGMKLPEFIRQFDEHAADWIEMGLDDVFAGIMPVEVTIDQMPKRFEVEDKTYSIEYTPVNIDGDLANLAVVISDVSALVENEKLEAEQREMMAMVHRIAEDRTGFLEFYQEANDIVESLQTETRDDLVLTKRRVHTLKGNSAIYGLVRVAEICHGLEDYIAENNELPEDRAWKDMFESWDSVRNNLSRIVGDQKQGLELTEEAFDNLFEKVLQEAPHGDLAVAMASWKLEPTSLRLNRIAEQTAGLAKRLGKGEINIQQSCNDLRLEPKRWSEFWSSFVHVVRNAVDHGLEPADVRLANGKPEIGQVEVETSLQGQQFVVSIRDDGQGIHWEKVTEAAYKKGLPAETQADLTEALFADGVSTAERVTDTSGRGVGMAAVKESCDRLGGHISVESELGVGTKFIFKFPVSSMAPETVELLSQRHVADPERAFSNMFSANDLVSHSESEELASV